MLSAPILQRLAPALVSGVLHYLATHGGFGRRSRTAPTQRRLEREAGQVSGRRYRALVKSTCMVTVTRVLTLTPPLVAGL